VVRKGERRTNPFRERKQFNSTDYIDGAVPSLPLLDAEEEEEEEEKFDKKQREEMDD